MIGFILTNPYVVSSQMYPVHVQQSHDCEWSYIKFSESCSADEPSMACRRNRVELLPTLFY